MRVMYAIESKPFHGEDPWFKNKIQDSEDRTDMFNLTLN